MRICIQRVSRAAVILKETQEVVGQIEQGLFVLLGICDSDSEKDVQYLASKVATLRVFEDEAGKMNLGLQDVQGKMLIVSQFTLFADCRKGRRPSFTEAARPEKAIPLYELFVQEVRNLGILVETGRFQQEMQVELINDGPVTIWIDSQDIVNQI